MRLHTASEVISRLRVLENDAAEFYDRLCCLGKAAEDLRAFARENRRNVVQVQQAYNNVISDALEGGFAFDIEADEFGLTLPSEAPFPEAVKAAADMETTFLRLYGLAAQQSRALLPDVARVFNQITQKRKSRIEKLRSLT
jgi:hypothetical protein